MKSFDSSHIQDATKILQKGGIIAFPTETVFGLGVVYDNSESYKRLVAVKQRPPEKPFTLMCANQNDVEKYAYVSGAAKKLIKAFMPGQFTIILKAKEFLPSWVVSKDGMVGIRVPDYPLVNELIRNVGKPLLVPSANKSGMPPILEENGIDDIFDGEIDGKILGETTSNVPSTIVIVKDDKIEIVREGMISKKEIEQILEEE